MLHTVYELPMHMFPQTAPVFADAWCDRVYLEAVIEGRQAGRIFVDDPDHPRTALMTRSYDYFIAGTVNEAFRAFIQDTPEEVDIFQRIYGLVPLSDAWETALLQDLGERVVIVPRRNFTWAGDDLRDVVIAPPEGMRIVALDSALAARVNTEIYHYAPLLTYFWGDTDIEKCGQFGYCALSGDVITGVCHSVSVSNTQVNLGVETAAAFHRRGVGLAVCRATIQHAQRLGLQPTWDADGNNVASVALARRLGFREGRPFTELAAPERKKWTLSEGIWQSAPGADGVVVWSRQR
ncbi:MAG: GNAT family N-acetyltransferase [Anaerolineae bacterium]|nr:GNAT family N-acetyltransferase [Anaerolineae bacterium]